MSEFRPNFNPDDPKNKINPKKDEEGEAQGEQVTQGAEAPVENTERTETEEVDEELRNGVVEFLERAETDEQEKKKYDPIRKFVKEKMELDPEEFKFYYKTVAEIKPDPEEEGYVLGTFKEFNNYHDLLDFRNKLSEEQKEKMDGQEWSGGWHKIAVFATGFWDRLANPEDELYKYKDEFYELYEKIKNEEIEDEYARKERLRKEYLEKLQNVKESYKDFCWTELGKGKSLEEIKPKYGVENEMKDEMKFMDTEKVKEVFGKQLDVLMSEKKFNPEHDEADKREINAVLNMGQVLGLGKEKSIWDKLTHRKPRNKILDDLDKIKDDAEKLVKRELYFESLHKEEAEGEEKKGLLNKPKKLVNWAKRFSGNMAQTVIAFKAAEMGIQWIANAPSVISAMGASSPTAIGVSSFMAAGAGLYLGRGVLKHATESWRNNRGYEKQDLSSPEVKERVKDAMANLISLSQMERFEEKANPEFAKDKKNFAEQKEKYIKGEMEKEEWEKILDERAQEQLDRKTKNESFRNVEVKKGVILLEKNAIDREAGVAKKLYEAVKDNPDLVKKFEKGGFKEGAGKVIKGYSKEFIQLALYEIPIVKQVLMAVGGGEEGKGLVKIIFEGTNVYEKNDIFRKTVNAAGWTVGAVGLSFVFAKKVEGSNFVAGKLKGIKNEVIGDWNMVKSLKEGKFFENWLEAFKARHGAEDKVKSGKPKVKSEEEKGKTGETVKKETPISTEEADIRWNEASKDISTKLSKREYDLLQDKITLLDGRGEFEFSNKDIQRATVKNLSTGKWEIRKDLLDSAHTEFIKMAGGKAETPSAVKQETAPSKTETPSAAKTETAKPAQEQAQALKAETKVQSSAPVMGKMNVEVKKGNTVWGIAEQVGRKLGIESSTKGNLSPEQRAKNIFTRDAIKDEIALQMKAAGKNLDHIKNGGKIEINLANLKARLEKNDIVAKAEKLSAKDVKNILDYNKNRAMKKEKVARKEDGVKSKAELSNAEKLQNAKKRDLAEAQDLAEAKNLANARVQIKTSQKSLKEPKVAESSMEKIKAKIERNEYISKAELQERLPDVKVTEEMYKFQMDVSAERRVAKELGVSGEFKIKREGEKLKIIPKSMPDSEIIYNEGQGKLKIGGYEIGKNDVASYLATMGKPAKSGEVIHRMPESEIKSSWSDLYDYVLRDHKYEAKIGKENVKYITNARGELLPGQEKVVKYLVERNYEIGKRGISAEKMGHCLELVGGKRLSEGERQVMAKFILQPSAMNGMQFAEKSGFKLPSKVAGIKTKLDGDCVEISGAYFENNGLHIPKHKVKINFDLAKGEFFEKSLFGNKFFSTAQEYRKHLSKKYSGGFGKFFRGKNSK